MMDENKSDDPVDLTPAQEAEDYRAVFSALIRQAREKAGYSTVQLSDSTRIMLKFIEAFENGDFSQLPDPVYARGFVKNICKTLGAEPLPLLLAFEKALGTRLENKALHVPVQESVKNVKLVSDRANRLRELKDTFIELLPSKVFSKVTVKNLTILGSVLLGLSIIGYLASSNGSKPKTTAKRTVSEPAEVASEDASATEETEEMIAQPPEAHVELAATPVETKVLEEAEPAKVEKTEPVKETVKEVVAAAPQPQAAPEPQAAPKVTPPAPEAAPKDAQFQVSANGEGGPQLLQITVSQPVKLRMRVDSEKWATTQYEPNNYEFRFSQSAEVLVFNAAAVTIAFNGKTLGPLGKEGRVRRLSFVAANELLENTKKM